ncbi:MAG TPA: ABC transporter substrate-binding protein [Chloroflexota bacterium]|nr:ABC transporter substrate-binding protein [Chloroflexota bacterium]
MRISASLATAAAALLVLAGCGGAAQQPAASASGSPANAPAASSPMPTKLLVIYSAQSIDQTPEWAALDGGYFKKSGLDVDLQYIAGGTKTVGALLAGESQVSVQGGNEAMSAVSNGADLVLIANLLPIYAFKLEAIKGINSIDDLKGKKLGVSTVGGTADVALRTFLRKHAIDPEKDVTIVATGDPSTTLAALTGGAVQASLSVPPNLLQAEAAGTHAIGDLASEKLPNAQNSVTVHRSWLNANRPVAQKLVDSLVQSLARVKQDKAFTEEIMKKYLKYDDQKGLDYTYDYFSSEVWPAYPDVRPDQLADGIAELSKNNEKLKTFDPSVMIDDSLIQDAEKRGVAGK